MGNYILGPGGELYHYGIKGMKWGVRRYQNPDGSYTEAGKRRNLKAMRKAAKSRPGGRPTLGYSVGKNDIVTSAANRVRSIQQRRGVARNRLGKLRGEQEAEDHKKFEDFCRKNGRYPTEKEHAKMMRETYQKHKKQIDAYEAEARKLDAEYKTAVKETINDYLGKYGSETVSYTAHNRKIIKSAEDWLAIELEWGNETRSD